MDKGLGREALILAGGLGTRLQPVVADRPKPIAEVAGRPFLERLLHQLSRHGYRRAVLCVGYKAEQIEAELGDAYGPLALAYSFEDKPLGTGGALRQAVNMVEATHVLAMNGDSFCDMDLDAFSAVHTSQRAMATIATVHREDRSRSGAVEMAATGRITVFAGRPVMPTPGLINAGVYMLRRELLLAIPAGRFVSLEDKVFPQLAQRDELFGYRVDADFIDIGTPDSYQAAQDFFSKR